MSHAGRERAENIRRWEAADTYSPPRAAKASKGRSKAGASGTIHDSFNQSNYVPPLVAFAVASFHQLRFRPWQPSISPFKFQPRQSVKHPVRFVSAAACRTTILIEQSVRIITIAHLCLR